MTPSNSRQSGNLAEINGTNTAISTGAGKIHWLLSGVCLREGAADMSSGFSSPQCSCQGLNKTSGLKTVGDVEVYFKARNACMNIFPRELIVEKRSQNHEIDIDSLTVIFMIIYLIFFFLSSLVFIFLFFCCSLKSRSPFLPIKQNICENLDLMNQNESYFYVSPI